MATYNNIKIVVFFDQGKIKKNWNDFQKYLSNNLILLEKTFSKIRLYEEKNFSNALKFSDTYYNW